MTSRTLANPLSLVLALGLLVLAGTAYAQSPQFLGTYRDWNVYKFADQDQTICYIASEPTKTQGNYTRRDPPAILVTRRSDPQVVDEVSVQPGYSYFEGSEVEVEVDGNRTFMLFTRGEHAWTKSAEEDEALIAAMRRGSNLTVRGTSVKNTWSLDSYSLLGFTAAYESMIEACS